MKTNMVDCFMLMGTTLALRGGQKLPEMGRPLLQDVFTTFVNISLIIQEVQVVDLQNMNIFFGGLLNQKWVDPRLGANIKTRKMAVAGQIWKPKIVGVNGQNILANNEDTVFWRGYGDEGNVLLSEKVQITVFCTRNFENFPFDTQICQLKFGSFRFPSDEVEIIWDGVQFSTQINSNEFSMDNILNFIEIESRPSGNFSVAVLNISIRRFSLHYIFCVFVPIFTIITLNYISMLLGQNQKNSRLNIQFLSVGGLMYFYYFSTCILQPTPYLKALDIFTVISLGFGTFSLMETLLIIGGFCYMEQRKKFHLEQSVWPKQIEFMLRLSYPVFYLVFLALFGAVYVS